MRRVLIPVGFVFSLIVAAGSFASIMEDDTTGVPRLAEQTFLIPKSHGGGIDDCLAEQSDCGRAAAASICETKGYRDVLAYGEASPEDMTGSVETSSRKTAVKEARELPFLITCTK